MISLNFPDNASRFDRIAQGLAHLLDGSIQVLSLGFLRSDFHLQMTIWIMRKQSKELKP